MNFRSFRFLGFEQWRGESETAGEAARLMVTPPVILFCLLVWNACYAVGTTCNDCQSLRNTFRWMGTLQAPQHFHGRFSFKDLYLALPKSWSNIAAIRMTSSFFWILLSPVSTATKSSQV